MLPTCTVWFRCVAVIAVLISITRDHITTSVTVALWTRDSYSGSVSYWEGGPCRDPPCGGEGAAHAGLRSVFLRGGVNTIVIVPGYGELVTRSSYVVDL